MNTQPTAAELKHLANVIEFGEISSLTPAVLQVLSKKCGVRHIRPDEKQTLANRLRNMSLGS